MITRCLVWYTITMNKTLVVIVLGIIIVAGVVFWQKNKGESNANIQATPTGYTNISYMIDGQSVALVDGHAEVASAPGSASKTTTDYFGNEATGDLNGDGMSDVAFVITQSGGGSGTFYYVVAALKTASGYQGTNAVLLGDRIAPQTTEVRDGEVVVNYAQRKSDEPMTAQPSIGVSKYLRVDGTELVEVKK